MKNTILLLILSCLGLFAQTTLMDFTHEKPKIYIVNAQKVEQSYSYETVEGRENALKLTWNPQKHAWLEFSFAKNPPMNSFTTATFAVDVWIPNPEHIDHFNIRFRDKFREILQYRTSLDRKTAKPGWQTITFNIDNTKPPLCNWGGIQNNGRIEFPASFQGLTIDFKDRTIQQGTAAFGKVVYAVKTDLTPATPTLDTGNPLGILVPGQEQNFRLKLENTKPRTLDGKLEFVIKDHDGNPVQKGSFQINLPTGKTAYSPLPAPKLLGIYTIDYVFKESDPNIDDSETTRSFAYMKPAGPTPGRGVGFLFGVCSHPQSKPRHEQELEAMAAAWCGAKILREDVWWNRFQPEEDRWNFEDFDFCVDVFAKQNVEIEAIYSFGNPWANASDTVPLDPSRSARRPDYKHWANFIRTFAERYRHKVHYVEVWNEPDLIGFANFGVDEYIELMKIAYRETKKAAPEMTMLTAGFTCMPPERPSSGFRDPQHMVKAITKGRGFYDVHAIHIHGTYERYKKEVDALVKLRQDLDIPQPWYSNETAISSTHAGDFVQATTLFRKFLFAWSRGAMGYNWYDLRNDGYDPKNGEHNFGLVTRDFQPKMAYVVFNTLASYFTQAKFIRQLDCGPSMDIFLFQDRDGNWLIPFWNMDRRQTSQAAILTDVTGTATLIDMFSNETPINVSQNTLVFSIDKVPAFIKVTGQDNPPKCSGNFFRLASKITHLKGEAQSQAFKDRQRDLLYIPGEPSELSFEIDNPTSQPVEVSLAIIPPKGIAADRQSINFKLGAAETAKPTFVVTVDPSLYDQRTPIQVDTKFSTFWNVSYKAVPARIHTCHRSIGDRQPDFILDSKEQYIKLANEAGDLQHLTWQGLDDLSAKVWIACDETNFILKADVVDDKHVQPYKGFDIWNADSIQFAVSAGLKTYAEIGLARTNDGKPETFVFSKANDKTPSVNLVTTRTGNATTYTATIPLADLALTPQRLKEGFLVNVLVNDNDENTREGYLELAKGIGEYKSERHFVILKQ